MVKVITYGTYDLLHYGHIRLLERAKALGDYLIVGVTADGFDKARGKINVQQSLMERIEAVKATGLANEVIVEEYEGQKIDDILRYNVDIFAIGSDWQGYFDYLNEYCKVVYLDRTQGISSSDLRAEKRELHLGLVGDSHFLNKMEIESHYVNGVKVTALCTNKALEYYNDALASLSCISNEYEHILDAVDAVYLISKPEVHYSQIKTALLKGKHVLCEPPIALTVEQWQELNDLALKNKCILMDAIRTAYSTAYYRMLLLIKSGRIGKVYSVDASCSSLWDDNLSKDEMRDKWNSINTWGPNAMLPIFQILGTGYSTKQITSHFVDRTLHYDSFTKIAFVYPEAVASIKVGKGVKTEGELVVSGTTGYIYVPAPWWKMDYFEIRREDPTQNKRYFYQLDGEGIRYELVSFLKAIEEGGKSYSYIDDIVSRTLVSVISDFYNEKDLILI